jgi:hypothetical protein
MSATGESGEFVAHEFVAAVTDPANEILPEVAHGRDAPRRGGE